MFHYENPQAKHEIVNVCDFFLFFCFALHRIHSREWHVFDEFPIDIMIEIECCPEATVYDKVEQIEKQKESAPESKFVLS